MLQWLWIQTEWVNMTRQRREREGKRLCNSTLAGLSFSPPGHWIRFFWHSSLDTSFSPEALASADIPNAGSAEGTGLYIGALYRRFFCFVLFFKLDHSVLNCNPRRSNSLTLIEMQFTENKECFHASLSHKCHGDTVFQRVCPTFCSLTRSMLSWS